MLFNDPGTDFLDYGGNSRARSPGSPTQIPQFDRGHGNNGRARSPGSPVQFLTTTRSTNYTIGSSSSGTNPFLSRNEIMRPLSRDLSSSMGGIGSMGKPDSRPDTSGSRRSDSESNLGSRPSSKTSPTQLTFLIPTTNPNPTIFPRFPNLTIQVHCLKCKG